MKICYLSDSGSVHTRKWCRYFSEKGHEVHVISLRNGELDCAVVHSLGFDQSLSESGSLLAKLKYLTKFWKVRKIIKNIRPDVVHAHYATSYGMLAALSGIRPFYLSVWGSDVYDFPSNFITKSMLRYVLRQAEKIFSTSRDMARQTALFTCKPIEITPFGVDMEIFYPIKGEDPTSKMIIGCVKKLEPHYGIQNLLKAFCMLDFNNLELHIAGEGTQKEELQKLAKELGVESKVKWLGFISQEKRVADVFRSFDIAVVPSLAESFGVSAIEAQACGVPVIVSNVGGLPETVQDGVTGIIIPPDDVVALRDAMQALMNDREKRIQMGCKGREFVCREYNVNDVFGKIEKIYVSSNKN